VFVLAFLYLPSGNVDASYSNALPQSENVDVVRLEEEDDAPIDSDHQ
jgi:hypothetical protein